MAIVSTVISWLNGLGCANHSYFYAITDNILDVTALQESIQNKWDEDNAVTHKNLEESV
jgi:hypothetical protein